MRISAFLLFSLLVISSCDDARVYEQLEHIDGKDGWNQASRINFETEISDTNILYNLLFDLRIDDNYPYSNLYILLHHTDPDSISTKQMKHFELADEKGKWLGSGLGDIHSYRLPMAERIKFHKAGKHRFGIEQNMRVDVLSGVKDVGIRLERAE